MKTVYSTLFWLIIISLLLTSCGEGRKQPKVNYDTGTSDSQANISIFSDTTKIQVASLPVSFDSTNVLLQISGLISTEKLSKKRAKGIISYGKSSDRYDEIYLQINEYGKDDCIRGWFSNIYFDDLTTNKQQLLTDKLLFISEAKYLRKLRKSKRYILYSVYDKDSNKDNKINQKDLLSKYISNLDGGDFKRITPEGHDFIKGAFVEEAGRYYFITLEDINKDGYFTKGDKYHYYYIGFCDETYFINEYNPLNSI